MQYKEYNYIDKSIWGEGEWQNEPDKIQWKDEETRLPCIIRRAVFPIQLESGFNGPGNLCGYVGVYEGHPLFGKFYNLDEVSDLSCHGGITFSETCVDESDELGICHVDDDDCRKVWWFGFDCGHCFDLMPGYSPLFDIIKFEQPNATYKNIEFVRNQCKELAKQLYKIGSEK